MDLTPKRGHTGLHQEFLPASGWVCELFSPVSEWMRGGSDRKGAREGERHYWVMQGNRRERELKFLLTFCELLSLSIDYTSTKYITAGGFRNNKAFARGQCFFLWKGVPPESNSVLMSSLVYTLNSQQVFQWLLIIDTYTHSPGLEQFPFLSLQPSRQMAVKEKKDTKISLLFAAGVIKALLSLVTPLKLSNC